MSKSEFGPGNPCFDCARNNQGVPPCCSDVKIKLFPEDPLEEALGQFSKDYPDFLKGPFRDEKSADPSAKVQIVLGTRTGLPYLQINGPCPYLNPADGSCRIHDEKRPWGCVLVDPLDPITKHYRCP